MIKVGIGYDVHRLKKGEELLIGGIKIPSAFGSLRPHKFSGETNY